MIRWFVELLFDHTLERSRYWALLIACLAVLFSAFSISLGLLSSWKAAVIALGGVITAATSIVKIWEFLEPRLRQRRDVGTLTQRLGAELYSSQDILDATRGYIQPDFQSVDPSGAEDFRRTVGAREQLFSAADRMLESPGENKFIVILGDSGMGKTSFLLNYYAYHWRVASRRKRFAIVLVPLNLRNSTERIKNIRDRSNTVVFLDALDEDGNAISDHRARIQELVDLTTEFRSVVITCRTQFFAKDEEVPTETGVIRITPVKASTAKTHVFQKLYIAPFTDAQVKQFLRFKFPLFRHAERRAAWEVVRKIPDLVARPMLLAHVEDLVKTGFQAEYSFQIYEEMISAWLERERGFVNDLAALRTFCELVAVNIFNNRKARGMERMRLEDLEPLAMSYGIRLQDWQLRGRSLLNRDAQGNYKFAHRSFLEYLCVKKFATGTELSPAEPWTDVMRNFLLELLAYGSSRTPASSVNYGIDFTRLTLRGADLDGANLRSKRLDRVDMGELDLSRCLLGGASFVDANLSGADLRSAELTKCNFTSAKMEGANLSGQHLTSCSFRQASLRSAILESTVMDYADLTMTDLREAELKGASFKHAILREAVLENQRLSDVNFSDAVLEGANLWRASLSRAKCDGVDFRTVDLGSSELRGCSLRHAVLKGKDFTGKDLSEIDFTSANLENVDLTHADLGKSDLSEANLANARAIGTKFGTCRLKGTILRGVVLSGADLSSVVDLSQEELRSAFGDGETLLPKGFRRPQNWTSQPAHIADGSE